MIFYHPRRAFGAPLQLANALSIYFFGASAPYSGDPVARRTGLVLRALPLCALDVVTCATMQ